MVRVLAPVPLKSAPVQRDERPHRGRPVDEYGAIPYLEQSVSFGRVSDAGFATVAGGALSDWRVRKGELASVQKHRGNGYDAPRNYACSAVSHMSPSRACKRRLVVTTYSSGVRNILHPVRGHLPVQRVGPACTWSAGQLAPADKPPPRGGTPGVGGAATILLRRAPLPATMMRQRFSAQKAISGDVDEDR